MTRKMESMVVALLLCTIQYSEPRVYIGKKQMAEFKVYYELTGLLARKHPRLKHHAIMPPSCISVL